MGINLLLRVCFVNTLLQMNFFVCTVFGTRAGVCCEGVSVQVCVHKWSIDGGSLQSAHF